MDKKLIVSPDRFDRWELRFIIALIFLVLALIASGFLYYKITSYDHVLNQALEDSVIEKDSVCITSFTCDRLWNYTFSTSVHQCVYMRNSTMKDLGCSFTTRGCPPSYNFVFMDQCIPECPRSYVVDKVDGYSFCVLPNETRDVLGSVNVSRKLRYPSGA